MKYMLLMNTPGKVPYQIMSWPKQDIQAHIGHMIALNKKLRASHRRRVPRVEGIPDGLLDRGRGQPPVPAAHR